MAYTMPFKSYYARGAVFFIFVFAFISMKADINTIEKPKKSLHHVLLFKWKAGVSPEKIEELKTVWNRLVKKVDGFDSFEMLDVTTDNYDHVAILTFSSEDAMESYIEHEDHQRLAAQGPELVESFMEYDYWD